MMVGMGYIGLDSGRLYRMRRGPKLIEAVASGTTIIINDATEGRPFRRLRVFGQTEQQRTTGAQLLPEQAVSNYFISLNGDIVGKNNSDYSKIIQNTENTTYYIFRKNVGTRFRAAYVDAIPTGNTPCTGVVDDTKDNISITVPAGKVLIINMEDTKAFDGLMVQKTRDRLPYEPYTGGKPSPSPEYKQEPEDAGKDGSIEVKVGGRNLFDGKFESGSIRQDNGENQDYADRIRTAGFIQIKPSTVYSIKLLETISFSVRWYDKDKKFIKSEATNTISQSPDNARYMRFLLLTTKLDTKCMVYAGSAPTPYEPYRDPQTLTLATPNGLPGIPVTKDGNYTDENGQQWICDEIDLGRGKYVQRVKEINPADYDRWILDKTTGNLRFKIIGTDAAKKTVRSEILSNRFTFLSYGHMLGGSFTYNSDVYFYLPSTVTTVEECKQWFVDNQTTIYYQLETPIERDLTPEEIAAYKALRTYGPTTVVSNDAGAEMEITYRKDKKNEKTHWNKVD